MADRSEVETTDAARPERPAATTEGPGGATPAPRPPAAGLNRRQVVRFGVAAAGAVAAARWGAAGAQGTPAATPDADGRIPSGMDGVPDAYTRLPAPFPSVAQTPGSGGTVTTYQITYDPPVPGRDDNRFWQELERRLGVRLEADMQPAESYGEKLAAITAGGDLPDLTVLNPVSAPDQYRTLEQGAFVDLTAYLSGDALQEFPNLARYPAYLWRNVAVGGKIYGVPRETFRTGTVLAARLDWADRVGLPQPRDAEEVVQLFDRFTHGDPDGNGSPDTYGLGASAGGVPFSRIFVGNMFRVPNVWRRNDDGTLTNQIETEEFAQAVAYMRRLWEAGLYHPDTPTMTSSQAKDALAAGRIGAFNDGPGGLPSSGGLRGRAAEINPAAVVGGLVPPGHDGGEGVSYNDRGYWGFVGIPTRVGDEERVKELLRILDYYAAPFGSEEWRFLNYGLEGVHHTVEADGTLRLTQEGIVEIGDLTYLATPPTVFFYDRPGDAEYMQGLIKAHVAIGIENPVLTLFSPTEAEEGAQLNQLQVDRLTGIVTGREPLDALQGMIDDWRSRGGDRIREEYQEGLAASS